MNTSLKNSISNQLLLFNQWLYDEYNKLSNRTLLTFPYLVTPTKEYETAKVKVLVENWETNGWGEKEYNQGVFKDFNDLLKIYTDKININCENLGVTWPMYYALRNLSEKVKGEKPLVDCLVQKVGFMQSNVALIGKPYGQSGYDNSILPLLRTAQDRFLKCVQPNVLLLGIGFGTNKHSEKPYLEILEKTYLGKLISKKQIEDCKVDLFELNFENSGAMRIFGYRHPRGLSYQEIIPFIKSVLINMSSMV